MRDPSYAEETASPAFEQQLLLARIIVAALAAGVGVFGAIVLTLSGLPPPGGKVPPLLTLLAAAETIAAFLASLALARMLDQQFVRSLAGKPDDSRMLQWYTTRLIVGCALFESAAFFNLVAYLLDPAALPLGLAGLMLTGILLQFPRRSQVLDWIERLQRQARELADLRRV